VAIQRLWQAHDSRVVTCNQWDRMWQCTHAQLHTTTLHTFNNVNTSAFAAHTLSSEFGTVPDVRSLALRPLDG
jgi:hypothetical protein